MYKEISRVDRQKPNCLNNLLNLFYMVVERLRHFSAMSKVWRGLKTLDWPSLT